MRISLIGPVHPYRGGISYFSTRLAHELRKSGHEVQVISFSRQYPAWLYPGKSDKDPSNEYLQVDALYLLDPLYPWTWIKTFKVINRWKPDIVLIQWWTTFWGFAYTFISTLLRNAGIKTVYIIHNILPHEERLWDRVIAKKTLSTASRFIVLSENELYRLKNIFPNAQVTLSHLPVFNLTERKYDQQEAKNKLGLPFDAPILLFFGIVRPYKGLKYAIQALAKLRKQGINAYLLVAGEFWENVNKYLQMVEQLDLSDHVIFHNRYIPNEEVGLYFSAADAFIAPYVGGTQSGVITIAMDYGLPVIASKWLKESLKQIDYPISFIDPSDTTMLASTIMSCIHSGRVNSYRVYDWSNLISAILDVDD